MSADMKVRIESRIGIQAPSDRIWEQIETLSDWGRWNTVERDVSGTIAFGGSVSLTEAVPGLPERAVSGKVTEWQPLAQLVIAEKRGFLFNTLRYFEIEELEPGSCIFANGMIFNGVRAEMWRDKHHRAVKEAYAGIGERMKVLAESL
jgi:hypothetical protein